MTAEINRSAYQAFKALCEQNNNLEPLEQLQIMVAALGADRAYLMATNNANLPDEVKGIMHCVARHMESLNKTS